MKKVYKLSDKLIPGDKLSSNILDRKEHLYEIIKSFSNSSENNGFFAEEIMRISFDAVNLNNLYRNHPNVDLGIIDEIEGVVKEREIISIKSSIKKENILSILKDSKSIKIESLLAYIVYANSNFQLDYQNNFFKLGLLKRGLDLCYKSDVDYKKLMNITLYYLIVNNNEIQDENYTNDINSLISDDDNLSNGNYDFYKKEVLKKLINLNSPISIGTVHTIESQENPNDTICVFNKTNPIKLNVYWLKILDIWCTNKYFNIRKKSANSTNDTIIEKYLTGTDIKKLFELEGSDFPITIEIGTGDYKPNEIPVDVKKTKNDDKLKRYQIFNKFIDTDFGIYNNRISRTLNYMINDLKKDPSKILKYQEFIKK